MLKGFVNLVSLFRHLRTKYFVQSQEKDDPSLCVREPSDGENMVSFPSPPLSLPS